MYSILIGSPVRQKPAILKEFLLSLEQLEKDGLQVYYFFIDDNDLAESSKLLHRFKNSAGHTAIFESKKKERYTCDKTTHYWSEHLIWKVAGFKNKIIRKALEKNHHYLFLVDSDLVLHPKTLKRLISTGKDIISTVYWTKWQPDECELPQVWLHDQYELYHKKRRETLTRREIYARQQQFLQMLKIPGTYEVGGLGACTLISRKALQGGVNFSEIKNLSFWGEDRHFCIRAAALGFSLFADTHFPAYHIYREDDIKGVEKYRQSGRANLKPDNFMERAEI